MTNYRQQLEHLCAKLGLKLGVVRVMADKAGLPSDDRSLVYMIKQAGA